MVSGPLTSRGSRLVAEMPAPFQAASGGRLEVLRLWVRSETPEPDTAAAERCEVVFDGQLHNHAELCRELGTEPSARDAEVVLRAYLRWGEEVVNRLRGVYALVIWNGARRTLSCVRDALGTYPVFYSQAGGEVLVSTSPMSLLRHPSVSKSPSPIWFADRIRHLYPDPGLTQYRDVRRVMPGHLLRCVDGTTESYRYWHPIAPDRPVDWIREDALERFGELLERKIGDYTGDLQAAIFLSGGLDSISVAGLARDHCRRSGTPAPWALSLQFTGAGEADESATQRRVAEVLDIPLLLLPFDEAVGEQGLVSGALDVSASLSAPLLNPWLPAYRALGRSGRARGCEVILTGGGGDEWLTVSSYLAADLIRKLDVAGWVDLYRSKKRDYRMTHPEALRCLLWTCGLRPLLRDRWNASPGWRSTRASLRRLLHRRSQAQGGDPYGWFLPDLELRQEVTERMEPQPVCSPDYYFRSMWETLNHPVISSEAEELFEYGQPDGFMVRRPYWDAETIEFLCRIPPRLLNTGQRSKGLVRRLLATRFPDFGVERQVKVNAADFFERRVMTEAPPIWKSLGGLRVLGELGVVEPDLLQTEFQGMIHSGQGQHAHRLWMLLSLESWLRTRI